MVYLNPDKILALKYIPNGSQITIFASFYEKNNVYNTDFIGPRSDVIDNVASEYYNISDTISIFSAGIFLISMYSLVRNING